MAGPYPPEYGAGPVGPQMYPGGHRQPFPQQPVAEPYPENVASAYPGMLPPPVRYPRKRRWPLVAGAVLAVVVIAGLAAALMFGRGGDGAHVGRTDRVVGQGGDPGVPGRPDERRRRDGRPPHAVRAVRRRQGAPVRPRAGGPVRRRIPQAVQPRRGDLDRQDGVVVAQSGAGVVHHEGRSRQWFHA